jgi:hypothetical protein
MSAGTLKMWNAERGYGFIPSDTRPILNIEQVLSSGRLGRRRRGNSHGPRFVSLSPANKRSLCRGHLDRRSVMDGSIFNSKGVHVGVVAGHAVFGLKGQKLYDLKGSNIYKLNGDLVGHLPDGRGKENRLGKATDKLFPSP